MEKKELQEINLKQCDTTQVEGKKGGQEKVEARTGGVEKSYNFLFLPRLPVYPSFGSRFEKRCRCWKYEAKRSACKLTVNLT
jgi:hypothetical protein